MPPAPPPARLPRLPRCGRPIDWLVEALGFEVGLRFPDDAGGVAHAELRFEAAALTSFSDHDGYDRLTPKGDSVGQGMYLAVDDPAKVDAAFARATAVGAESVWEPEASEWSDRCRVRDPEGRKWTFGTHVPGAADGDWSGGWC